KARHAEIKASPEEMHRAALSDKPRPEFPQYRVDTQQDAPQPGHCRGVVGGMSGIPVEPHRVGDLNRHRRYVDGNTRSVQCPLKRGKELRDRSRPRPDGGERTGVELKHKLVAREVELQLQDARTCGHGIRAEPTSRKLKGYVPPMVYHRS